MNSFSDFPIPMFYTILIFLLNFDRFSWTNHGKRRLGRIPSQNRAKWPENCPNNREMSMKFLQNSKEIHLNFKKELLFLRRLCSENLCHNLNHCNWFFFVILDSFFCMKYLFAILQFLSMFNKKNLIFDTLFWFLSSWSQNKEKGRNFASI